MSKYISSLIIIGFVVLGLIFSGADFNIFKRGPMFELSSQEANATTSVQTISVFVTTTIQLSLATTTVALGTLTPGTPLIATTSATVLTNAANGWNFSTRRDDATSTLDLITEPAVDFPDYTAWSPGGYCSAGNATSTPGATLSFRVYASGTSPSGLYCAAYWGANDASPLWAGFPPTSQLIARNNTYSGTNQTVVYGLRADAPATQKSGSYDGTITMTALVNP